MNVFALLLRIGLALSIIGAGLIVGAQLRSARDQLAPGQAASAKSPKASATVASSHPQTPKPTRSAPTPSPSMSPSMQPAPTKAEPSPAPPTVAPASGPLAIVNGTVTAGGKPVQGARIMVYPSNSFNRGPTPVPPESGTATTDDRGVYQVALPPGTYRIGAFRSYHTPVDFSDGFAPVTWYGDGFMIGFGKDLVVSGTVARADIAMLASLTVAGRVVGRDGIGVPNAQVGLSRAFGGIQFPLAPVGDSTTDAAGRFSLSVPAMTMTLHVQAAGRTTTVWTSVDLDLRTERTDLVLAVDRGNVVSGTLRDASGQPLPNTNFAATTLDPQIYCVSCNGRTDGSGRFALTVPSTTVRFRNWPETSTAPELFSTEFVVTGDATFDPILERR